MILFQKMVQRVGGERERKSEEERRRGVFVLS